MPYIAIKKREVLDPYITAAVEALKQLGINDPHNVMSGNINYVITRIIAQIYPSPRYDNICTIAGILSNVKDEYYRRVGAPYEDIKQEHNGDVYY